MASEIIPIKRAFAEFMNDSESQYKLGSRDIKLPDGYERDVSVLVVPESTFRRYRERITKEAIKNSAKHWGNKILWYKGFPITT